MAHNSPFFDTILNPVPQAAPPHQPILISDISSATAPNTTSSTGSNSFTPAQQSLQARNKPFNSPHSAAAERYESRAKRYEALEILNNVELLMWFSQMRNETLPATRAHYTNISLGLPPPPPIYREEWQVHPSERVPSPARKPDRNASSSSSSSLRGPSSKAGPSSSSATPRKGTRGAAVASSAANSPAHPSSPAPAFLNESESEDML